MKYLILAMFGAGVLVGSVLYLHHANAGRPVVQSPRSEMAPIPGDPECPRADHSATTTKQCAQTALEPIPSAPGGLPAALINNPRLDAAVVGQAVDLLVSPQASFDQKKAVWKQLRESGGLDQAITELEQRSSNNRSNSEYAAVLGQAYLQKCGTISDVREQGILAMQADKVFDTALSLDPANWEARFTKAVALSYWPSTMGKSEEVIQHFLTLVQQQETQPAQPQFAETYVWLGDQYQKATRNDDARIVWERGAALFPENDKLRNKLASP